MKVWVVLYTMEKEQDTFVLDVYGKKADALKRMKHEQQLIKENPDTKFRDCCTMQERAVL